MSDTGTRAGWRPPATRPHGGTPLGEDTRKIVEARSKLRPLDLPRPVRVETDVHDRPVTVYMNRKARSVMVVRERWRIDDEWWRAPISRSYATVVLEDGRPLTVYEDLAQGGWYVHGGPLGDS